MKILAAGIIAGDLGKGWWQAMKQVKNELTVPSWAMWLGGIVLVYVMAKKIFEYLAA